MKPAPSAVPSERLCKASVDDAGIQSASLTLAVMMRMLRSELYAVAALAGLPHRSESVIDAEQDEEDERGG